MAATARAIAAVKVSMAGWPRHRPARKVKAANASITHSSNLPNWAILRCRGVAISLADEINCEIRPISVVSPMATTRPRACPKVTSVEA